MNQAIVDQVVEAVLYEGYILYPYRPSSKKNQQRFTFGRVYPEAYNISQKGAEPCVMQTQCLARGRAETALEVSVRFLHPMWREVGIILSPPKGAEPGAEPRFTVIPKLHAKGKLYQTWQEAVERKISLPSVKLGHLPPTGLKLPFQFPSNRSWEIIETGPGDPPAILARRQESLEGTVELAIEPLSGSRFKITVRILNQTPVEPQQLDDPDAILMRTFASTHTILHAEEGEFVSLMDPPADCQDEINGCKNIGAWPVLVGDESRNERDVLLSSPIILYDFPKIAPESKGNLFDGTEIDEILTLRIQTMTDEEKSEMRAVDELARGLLQRTESMDASQMIDLHGIMREPRSFDDIVFGPDTRLAGIRVGETYLKLGDQVRIRPKGRADAFDMILENKIGLIEAIEQDASGLIDFALVLEDDPGKDLGLLRQPGHRFFFSAEEVEPLSTT